MISFVNLPEGSGHTFTATRAHGVIPWALPRKAFEGVEHPVAPKINHGVEQSLMGLMRPNVMLHPSRNPFLCVDFKSGVNVTPMSYIDPYLKPVEDVWGSLAEHYPQRFVDAARDLSERMA